MSSLILVDTSSAWERAVYLMAKYVNAYIPTDAVVRSVIEKLVGQSDFQGVNAIDPFAGLWDTKLIK